MERTNNMNEIRQLTDAELDAVEGAGLIQLLGAYAICAALVTVGFEIAGGYKP